MNSRTTRINAAVSISVCFVVTVAILTAEDLDNDTLSDVWQRTFNATLLDPDDDDDNDGLSNWVESQLGTNPRFFDLPHLRVAGTSFEWTNLKGVDRTLELSSNLKEWQIPSPQDSDRNTTRRFNYRHPNSEKSLFGRLSVTGTHVLPELEVGAENPDDPVFSWVQPSGVAAQLELLAGLDIWYPADQSNQTITLQYSVPALDQKRFGRLRSVPQRDYDQDGLSGIEEALLGTNPYRSDSDRDSIDDANEFRLGYDPLVPVKPIVLASGSEDELFVNLDDLNLMSGESLYAQLQGNILYGHYMPPEGIPFSPDEMSEGIKRTFHHNPVHLTSPFEYYGKAIWTITPHRSGYLGFSGTSYTSEVEAGLPDSNNPRNAIFGLLLPYDRTSGYKIVYRQFADHITFEYSDLYLVEDGETIGPYKFQIKLFYDGSVELHYDRIPQFESIGLAGLQNLQQDMGVVAAYGLNCVESQSAIRLEKGYSWLSIPTHEDITPNSTVKLSVHPPAGFDGLLHAELLIKNSGDDTVACKIPIIARSYLQDSDSDGVTDKLEMRLGLDPYKNDTGIDHDSDGLITRLEIQIGTDHLDADTDGDGYNDFWEVEHASIGFSPNSRDTHHDFDGDGIQAIVEKMLGLDPLANDSSGDGVGDKYSDQDSDGVSDIVEYGFRFVATANQFDVVVYEDHADLDYDEDGVSNLDEIIIGSNPLLSDTDYDGFLDFEEIQDPLLDPIVSDRNKDYDKDGVLNYEEMKIGSNPRLTDTNGNLVSDLDEDTDGDGLTDIYELRNRLDFEISDSSEDRDGDGLSNFEEFELGLSQTSSDTDSDGLPDGFEVKYGFDPLLEDNSDGDEDKDGVTNFYEARLNLNPFSDDTDGDGIVDGKEDFNEDGLSYLFEIVNNLPPTGRTLLDRDYDTLENSLELELGTSPLNWDTDSDGMGDYYEHILQERDPLDSTDRTVDYDLDQIPDNSDRTLGFFPNFVLSPIDPDANENGIVDGLEDSDSDGIPDYFERRLHFLNPEIGTDATQDQDQDGLSNLEEFLAGSDLQLEDTDNDEIPDFHEVKVHLTSPKEDNSITDVNQNGILDPYEHELGFSIHEAIPPNLLRRDFDSDGISDIDEIKTGSRLDFWDAISDFDGDGLSVIAEVALGTSARSADTDEDGIWDGWEHANRLDPLSREGNNGGLADNDNDGVSNADEFQRNTDPWNEDSQNKDEIKLIECEEPTSTSQFGSGYYTAQIRFTHGFPSGGCDCLIAALGAPFPSDHNYLLKIYEIDLKTLHEKLAFQVESETDGGAFFAVSPTVCIDGFSTRKTYSVEVVPSSPNDTDRLEWSLSFIDRVRPFYEVDKIYDKVVSKNPMVFAVDRFDISEGVFASEVGIDDPQSIIGDYSLDTPEARRKLKNSRAILLPTQLFTDLDNDGLIGNSDLDLAEAAMLSGASMQDKERATEFLFSNDQISNGAWDIEDPDAPNGERVDDDAQEITVRPGIREGKIWFEHPSIESIHFYTDSMCRDQDRVMFHHDDPYILTPDNAIPDKLFIRFDEDFEFDPDSLQLDEYLCLFCDKFEEEIASIRLVVVEKFGAKDYFPACEDYIYEHNSRFCDREYEQDDIELRIVSMLEKMTRMIPLDIYWTTPSLFNIDGVMTQYKDSSVIINGNQCFFSDGRVCRNARGDITDRCHGRLVVNGKLNTFVSSDDEELSVLAGPEGKYLAQLENGEFTIRKGRVPLESTIDSALGGLSTHYDSKARENDSHQMVGRVVLQDSAMVFTATGITKGIPKDFTHQAVTSGVRKMVKSDKTEDLELVILDSGTSVALSVLDPSGNLRVVTKGAKHYRPNPTCYVNTYIRFKSRRPR